MSEALQRIGLRIRDSLDDLAIVIQRVEEGWGRYQKSIDDYYLDGVALNLHGFYSGLERIFELIATTVDGTKPDGEHWHQALLQQITSEMPGVRPAVLSIMSSEKLDEYRGFRHVVRNVYTYRFDPSKVEELVKQVPGIFAQVEAELLAFADYLEHQ